MTTNHHSSTSPTTTHSEAEVISLQQLPTLNPNSTFTSPSTTFNDIKSQLTSVQQQLTMNTIDLMNETSLIHHQEDLIKIAMQLQQQCEQCITLEQKLQLQHYQLQFEFKQQQINFENKIIQQQVELQQQQIDFQQQMKDQQYELKQEIKEELFNLQCQRREFELFHINQLNQPIQPFHSNPHCQSAINLDVYALSPFFNGSSTSISSAATISSIPSIPSIDQNNHFLDMLHDVHQDYEAMKYLVAKHKIEMEECIEGKCLQTLCQQNNEIQTLETKLKQYIKGIETNLNGDIKQLQSKTNRIDQSITKDVGNKLTLLESTIYTIKENIETRLDDEINELQSNMNSSTDEIEVNIETKLNQFETKLNRFDVRINDSATKMNKTNQMIDTKFNKIDQKIITFQQSFQQYTIQQYRLQSIENQRKMIQSILDKNSTFKKQDDELICFQFDNFQGIRTSCSRWEITNLFTLIQDLIVDKQLKWDLKEYKSTFQKGNLYLSTKSILHGEWIQVQGIGTLVNIRDLNLSNLLKPGDDVYDYSDYPCIASCGDCHGSPKDTTSKRFVIKIKWEWE